MEKLSAEEVQLQLLELAKENSKKFESIKNNVKFIAYYLIVSIIITAIILAKLFGETGYFRAY